VDVDNATVSLGASLTLTKKLTLSTTMIDNRVTIAQGSNLLAYIGNRQIAASVARAFRNHTLRVGFREMTLNSASSSVSEAMPEAEDSIQLKRFSASGAIRMQHAALGLPMSPAFRGGLDLRFARFTAHADIDSANITGSSVPFTSSLRSMSFRENARLGRGWNLSVESTQFFLTNRPNLVAGPSAVVWEQWNLSVNLVKQLKWAAKKKPG
jgi:hypothetical protein